VTNAIGSYSLLSLKTSVKSHTCHITVIIFITACDQNVRLQHERKR